MLFSNPEIARFVRENFVAAWESVRPVPVAEIDFGNGTKIKRTLNGNIATYLCAPDGTVLDVIPGLNAPAAYLEDLRHALNLYGVWAWRKDAAVLDYHKSNLAAPVRYELNRRALMSKSGIELPIKTAFDLKRTPGPEPATDEGRHLAADTLFNRTVRKPRIHQILAEKMVKPIEITKRVYKEVLHCDLDDPYLGLVAKAFSGGAYEGR